MIFVRIQKPVDMFESRCLSPSNQNAGFFFFMHACLSISTYGYHLFHFKYLIDLGDFRNVTTVPVNCNGCNN